MRILISLCLVVAVIANEDVLRAVLQSPKATLKLYQDFKSKGHLSYDGSEDRLRFRLFRKNAEFVMTSNEVKEDTANYELNFFSSMTEDEKSQYLGLNVTDMPAYEDEPLLTAPGDVPAEKFWVKGAVTAVKDQRSCGSCWSFGAVGGLETRYKHLSGRLRSFAEQEYLDCVYEGQRDGCGGGWPEHCYKYSKQHGGRLSATVNYPYRAVDGRCKASSTPNDMVAYKIDGYQKVASNGNAHIAALASGSLSVCFQVTDMFYQYKSGIAKDTTCTGRVNHAVTAVGYSKNYILVKNSWGSNWGDKGFVKFDRFFKGCGLFRYSSYPKLVSTGKKDIGPSDKATDYVPTDEDYKPDPKPDPKPNPDCRDVASNCKESMCTYNKEIPDKYCRRTCKRCKDEDKPEPKPVCKDTASNCNISIHCQNKEVAEKYCRKTCRKCSNCKDSASNCDVKKHCHNDNIAKKYCQKTCKRCKEEKPICADVALNCKLDFCQTKSIAEKYCRKTCKMCEEDDDDNDDGDDGDEKCPSGTIRCPDGICRHEHMC